MGIGTFRPDADVFTGVSLRCERDGGFLKEVLVVRGDFSGGEEVGSVGGGIEGGWAVRVRF